MGIIHLLGSLKQVVSGDSHLDQLKEKLAMVNDEIADLRRQLEKERLRSSDLFECVTVMERNRDEWKEMWFTQGREHLVAQQMLEHAIDKLVKYLHRMVGVCNEYRKKSGEPDFEVGSLLDDIPVGVSDGYRGKLAESERTSPKPVTAKELTDNLPNRNLDG